MRLIQEQVFPLDSSDLCRTMRTVQAPDQFQPLGGQGVLVEEFKMLDAERLDVDALDGPSIGRQSLDFGFDQVEVSRPPPGKLVGSVQPFEEPMEFADVAGAVLRG